MGSGQVTSLLHDHAYTNKRDECGLASPSLCRPCGTLRPLPVCATWGKGPCGTPHSLDPMSHWLRVSFPLQDGAGCQGLLLQGSPLCPLWVPWGEDTLACCWSGCSFKHSRLGGRDATVYVASVTLSLGIQAAVTPSKGAIAEKK